MIRMDSITSIEGLTEAEADAGSGGFEEREGISAGSAIVPLPLLLPLAPTGPAECTTVGGH